MTILEDVSGKPLEGETPPADAAAEAEAARRADVEARARLMGWKDKSEFDRPPERWVDAETFVARGENILPVLKENLHSMEEKLGASNRTVLDLRAELAANSKAVEHLRDLAVTAETRAFERAKREIERDRRDAQARLDAAAATADVAGVRAASTELAALRDPEPPKPQPAEPARAAATPAAPVVTDVSEAAAVAKFASDESRWFKKGSEAGDYASARYGSLLETQPGLSHIERLAEVKKAVVRRFPEVFENAAAREAVRVAAPSATGPTGARKKGWTYDDLPADIKAVADKTVADLAKGYKGPKDKAYGRQDYVNIYFAGQEPPR